MSEEISVPFFKPKTLKRSSNRQVIARGESSGESSSSNDEDKPVLGIPKRNDRQKHMIRASTKKREKMTHSLDDDDDNDEEILEVDLDVKYRSDDTASSLVPRDMGATARSEVDTEYDCDSQAQFERVQGLLKQERVAKEQEGDEASTSQATKVYRGMAMYGAKEKEDTIKGNASSGLNRRGPIRATQFMRASVRWDYAPDICKDYKETGFCTFGDSCKFMHDRTDYKHGWEIERDWNEGKLKEAEDDEYLISGDEDEPDNLPFSCFICRDSFKNPVVTKCKHYFCESCALEHYRKTKRCAACNEKTDGVFNVARDILNKMKAMDTRKALSGEQLTEGLEENRELTKDSDYQETEVIEEE